MAGTRIRGTHLLAGALTLIVVWLTAVTVQISTEPAPGASSVPELGERLAAALNERDTEALAKLIDYPAEDASGFAESYLDALAAEAAGQVRVTPREQASGNPLLQVSAAPDISYSLVTATRDGSWLVSLAPPV